MQLEGIHHVTAITGDARRTSTSTRACSASASSRRRSTRTTRPLPPLLRGREGQPRRRHHVLRVPGRAPGRAGDGMVHRSAGASASGRRSTSGPSGCAGEGVEVERDGDRLALRGPEGLGLELRAGRDRRAAGRRHPEVPAESRSRASTRARLLERPERAARLLEEALGFEPAEGGWEARGERRGGVYATTSCRPSAASRAPAPCTTSPGRPTMEEHAAWRPRRGGGRAADAGHRPLLVPLDLLPRAERRALRDRDARPRLHGRRDARAPRRALVLPPASSAAGPDRGRPDAAARLARGASGVARPTTPPP